MTINDPIADMLTRVRNANSAGKATVSMPSSKKLVEIARIMTEEGYVQGYEIIENSPRDILEITMKYGEKKDHSRHQAYFQARPAYLRWQGRTAPRSRRPGHCYRVHLQGRHGRPRRSQGWRRRRSYRIHLVRKG